MPAPIALRETPLEGVYIVECKRFMDERGYFMEAFSQPAWLERGHPGKFPQDNISKSSRGTLRGMHFQRLPHGQGKLVRVLAGAAFDVALDLRETSPTFGKWFGAELSEANGLAMWIPIGFGHGFQALADDTLVYYKSTAVYAPASEGAVRYDDPAVGIAWPLPAVQMSPKDEAAPLLRDAGPFFPDPG